MKLPLLAYNPYLYNAIQFIRFKFGYRFEFVDGAGQIICRIIRGRYRARTLSTDRTEITFYGMSDIHPYTNKKKAPTLADSTVIITKQTGVFPFLCESPGIVSDPNQAPALLFTTRYRFDHEPFADGWDGRRGNLYYLGSDPENAEVERVFYPDPGRHRLTLGDLLSRGIPREQIWPAP